jgi:hypothetical protein
MRIAIATCSAVPPQFDDDARLIEALEARGASADRVVWDDPEVGWDEFDLVVVRSTWDYPRKHRAFVAWADAVGERLRNPPALVRWNADKHHLADLVSAGIPTVPTHFVEPDDEAPRLQGEVVVKPTVSAGGRDTGRFCPAAHGEAADLVARLQAEGRAAMVQPYIGSVDDDGETALVFIAGQFSHAARKRAVLRPDEIAPTRDDEIGGAEVMYDPDIVRPGRASDRDIAVGARAIAYLRERFGGEPLYARVDLVTGRDGEPLLLELEAVEPNLLLGHSPDAADRLAAAILTG